MNTSAIAPTPRRGRPARLRPDSELDSRALLLRTGLAIWTEKGYSPVGLDEILNAAQVSKGSFYHQFESKEAFGLAVIEAYAQYFARKLTRWLEDTERDPIARMKGFVSDAIEGMARHGFRRGCLIGNLGQEMGALPESFRAALIATFMDWQTRTARCLQAGIDDGLICTTADAATLAQWFWIGWEGAVLRAKLERSPTPLTSFAYGFWQLLSLHTESELPHSRTSTQSRRPTHVSSPIDRENRRHANRQLA